MFLLGYFASHPWPLAPLEIALLLVQIVSAGLSLLWWWALYRRLIGRPVGPSVEFAASLRPRPEAPPPPPDPNLEVWKPWFRLYGPLFLELNNATGRIPTAWRGRAHEHAAYRFYMQDRLPEAVSSAQKALRCGTRPGLWVVKLMSIARAELDARESSRRVEHPPFVFELPEDDRQYDVLIQVAGACRARVESMLGFSPGATMFMLLNEEQLRRDAGSRWGYVAPKRGFVKICLLRSPQDGLAEASVGLVHEYVRLAVRTSSNGRAPDWLSEGLAQLVVSESVTGLFHAVTPPEAVRRLRPTERVLDFVWGRSRLDRMAAMGATASAIVRHIIDTYGESAVRQFVQGLAARSERSAFREAFGLSPRQFEHEWHERLRRQEEQG